MAVTGKFVSTWRLLAFVLAFFSWITPAFSDPFNQPWRKSGQALVIDAYEKNPIDWEKLKKHRAVRGFIGKASDGLPPPYACRTREETELTLCKKTFQNYWLKRELYHTRRMMAKSIGLKWGAYHLGRPGNPIDQANHFLDFAEPEQDELIALDIEHDDPEKWISFKDAEAFARHIHFRTGRYPVLYTNHDTAKRIAAQRDVYPLLSRLQLWYARFRSDVRGVFPLGNWDQYAMWQFSARANCNKKRCLYRVRGTEPDIDVNATGLTFAEFERAWPFDGLVPQKITPNTGANVTMVSKETKKPEPKVRYRMAVKFKVGRKTIRLASIAVPTPRIREEEEIDIPDPIHTAKVLIPRSQETPDPVKTVVVRSVRPLTTRPIVPYSDVFSPKFRTALEAEKIKKTAAYDPRKTEVTAYQYTSIEQAEETKLYSSKRNQY